MRCKTFDKIPKQLAVMAMAGLLFPIVPHIETEAKDSRDVLKGLDVLDINEERLEMRIQENREIRREVEEIAFAFDEVELAGLCRKACEEYPHVRPEVLYAMTFPESSRNPEAYNSYGCKGLVQIHEVSHKNRMERLGVTDLFDPYSNLLVGADFLEELSKDGKNPESYMLMRYNMKTETANRLWKQGIVSNYAKTILENAEDGSYEENLERYDFRREVVANIKRYEKHPEDFPNTLLHPCDKPFHNEFPFLCTEECEENKEYPD